MFFPLTLALAFKSLLRNNKVKLGIIDTIWCELGIELNCIKGTVQWCPVRSPNPNLFIIKAWPHIYSKSMAGEQARTTKPNPSHKLREL